MKERLMEREAPASYSSALQGFQYTNFYISFHALQSGLYWQTHLDNEVESESVSSEHFLLSSRLRAGTRRASQAVVCKICQYPWKVRRRTYYNTKHGRQISAALLCKLYQEINLFWIFGHWAVDEMPKSNSSSRQASLINLVIDTISGETTFYLILNGHFVTFQTFQTLFKHAKQNKKAFIFWSFALDTDALSLNSVYYTIQPSIHPLSYLFWTLVVLWASVCS